MCYNVKVWECRTLKPITSQYKQKCLKDMLEGPGHHCVSAAPQKGSWEDGFKPKFKPQSLYLCCGHLDMHQLHVWCVVVGSPSYGLFPPVYHNSPRRWESIRQKMRKHPPLKVTLLSEGILNGGTGSQYCTDTFHRQRCSFAIVHFFNIWISLTKVSGNWHPRELARLLNKPTYGPTIPPHSYDIFDIIRFILEAKEQGRKNRMDTGTATLKVNLW